MIGKIKLRKTQITLKLFQIFIWFALNYLGSHKIWKIILKRQIYLFSTYVSVLPHHHYIFRKASFFFEIYFLYFNFFFLLFFFFIPLPTLTFFWLFVDFIPRILIPLIPLPICTTLWPCNLPPPQDKRKGNLRKNLIVEAVVWHSGSQSIFFSPYVFIAYVHCTESLIHLKASGFCYTSILDPHWHPSWISCCCPVLWKSAVLDLSDP